MMNKKQNKLLVLLFAGALSGNAQFKYKAPLNVVKETGFYTIQITPELSSYIKTDFADIRIADEKGKWIPHIARQPFYEQGTQGSDFHRIVSSQHETKKSTIIFEGSKIYKINELILTLKNAAVERLVSVSGSNDQGNWFIIAENLPLTPATNNNTDSYQQQIKFPASVYAYYKLVINNEKQDPLNVVEIYSPSLTDVKKKINSDSAKEYIDNPVPVITQTNNGRWSIIKIEQQKPFMFHLLKLKAQGPKFYNRQSKLFSNLSGNYEQDWLTPAIAEFIIDSDHFKGVKFSETVQQKTSYLLVDNEDNPPLIFNSVTLHQKNTILVAELEAGKQYYLLLSDSAAISPKYDLDRFSERIEAEKLSPVQYQSIIANPAVINKTKETFSQRWIWPVIITVISLLAFLTWKLTAEMKRKGE
jgi:hypothetical protein